MAPNASPLDGQHGPPRRRQSRLTPADDPGEFEWIIYCRISDDREGGGLGVARQERECRETYRNAKLPGRILTVLTDNDLTANDRSGRYKPRPDYDRLCQMLRERPGRRGVLAWHTDRLHRTPAELETFIDLVETTGATVHTVRAGRIDLSTPSGRATARTLCAWARYESEHKSDRIRAKVRELAEAGSVYGGGPRPFGYTRIYQGEGNRRKIVRDEVNPAEARVVKECARRVLAGDTLRTVVRWLNADSIKTSTGRQWSQQSLRTMLASGRIAGLREHHGEVVGRAVWDPIITVEQHEQLRARLTGNQRPPGSRVRRHHLSGYVACSDCWTKGVKMRVAPQHGRLKYKCLPDVGGCNGRVIGLADLEMWVKSVVVQRLRNPQILAELAARVSNDTSRVAELQEAIDADERRLARLRVALDDGGEDDLPEVVASMRVIKRRIRDAHAEVGRLVGSPAAAHESFPELADRWDWLDLDQKQGLLGLFFERILIHPAVRGRSRFDPDRVEFVPVGGYPNGAPRFVRGGVGHMPVAGPSDGSRTGDAG